MAVVELPCLPLPRLTELPSDRQSPGSASSLQTDRARLSKLSSDRQGPGSVISLQTGPRLSELPSDRQGPGSVSSLQTDRAQAQPAPFRQMGLTDFCHLVWLLMGTEACPIQSLIHLSIPPRRDLLCPCASGRRGVHSWGVRWGMGGWPSLLPLCSLHSVR